MILQEFSCQCLPALPADGIWEQTAFFGDPKVAPIGDQCSVGEQKSPGASIQISTVRVNVLSICRDTDVGFPKVWVQKIRREGLQKDAVPPPDHVKRDILANDNVAREQPLVMERPRRHRPTTDPEEVMDVVESIHEQLSLQELSVGLGDDDVILDATGGR